MKYQCIVADPPWPYKSSFPTQSHSKGDCSRPIKHKPLPYRSMTIKEICDLPVDTISDKDCRLWLWTTNSFLPKAFMVMRYWGFEYRQLLVWHKSDANFVGSIAPNCEFILVGIKGSPHRKLKLKSAVFEFPQGKVHSRKPEMIQAYIERICEGPYIELFARRKRPGWSVWGNEIESDIELQ